VPILASLPLAKATEGRPTRPPRTAAITHSPTLPALSGDSPGTT